MQEGKLHFNRPEHQDTRELTGVLALIKTEIAPAVAEDDTIGDAEAGKGVWDAYVEKRLSAAA